MTYLALTLALILALLLLKTRRLLSHAYSTLSQNQQLNSQENQLLEQSHEQEIQRLLDALPHPFFSINEKQDIVRCNRKSADLLHGRHILSRSIRQVILDTPIIEAITSCLNPPTPKNTVIKLPPQSPFSQEHHHKDSHWEISLQPVTLRNNTRELQVMMRDITKSVEADQIRKDFVANASHELRTPLSIISGYLENLIEDGALERKDIAHRMLLTMERHVTRINRIVEDMLTISQLELEGNAPLKIASFPISECVDDVIDRLDLVISKQNATIKKQIPDLTVIGDQFYWTQILFNLIENALKQNTSTPVTITLTAQSNPSNDHFQFLVKDNGIGIPREDLPFIFKRFYRVEKHHSQNQIKGTGLGLSIVRKAVEAHGGTITAHSTPGVTTSFEITIPQPPQPPHES